MQNRLPHILTFQGLVTRVRCQNRRKECHLGHGASYSGISQLRVLRERLIKKDQSRNPFANKNFRPLRGGPLVDIVRDCFFFTLPYSYFAFKSFIRCPFFKCLMSHNYVLPFLSCSLKFLQWSTVETDFVLSQWMIKNTKDNIDLTCG